MANTSYGANALANNTTGNSNAAFGDAALQYNTSGSYNTAVGSGALVLNTVGYGNTAVGLNALNRNDKTGSDVGTNNTAVGNAAMGMNVSGNNNTAMGDVALGNMTRGSNNVAIGSDAMSQPDTPTHAPNGNTAIGTEALQKCIGLNNTGVGTHCGFGNSTGNSNTYLGYWAGSDTTTASFNVFLGYASGLGVTTGQHNLFVGCDAYSVASGVTTGSYNTIIGNNIANLSPTLSNSIVIAHGQGHIKAQYDGTYDKWTLTASYVEMTKVLLDNGFAIKGGTNKRMGTATLASGAVTVANTSVGANDRLFIQRRTAGTGTPGHLTYSLSTGTGFTITSVGGLNDNSVVDWMLVEQY